MTRAVCLAAFVSETKSNVSRGLPSSPMWQYGQRTPNAPVKLFMVASNSRLPRSLGSTCKLVNLSGIWPDNCDAHNIKPTLIAIRLDPDLKTQINSLCILLLQVFFF